MVIASVISIVAYFGASGELLSAFSPFLAIGMAFALSPVLCLATRGKYYLARADELEPPLQVAGGSLSTVELSCGACGETFERPDVASCPYYTGGIVCSLCCSLEKNCQEACKPAGTTADLPMPFVS